MTLSFKDLTKYSNLLSISFFALALLVQTPRLYPLWYIAELKSLGAAGTVGAFMLSVAFAFVVVAAAWICRYYDHVYLGDKFIPILAALFLTFGMTFLCKGEPVDPFPAVHPFWRYACLAYGLFLLDSAVSADEHRAHAIED
jgi:hypothetical protein